MLGRTRFVSLILPARYDGSMARLLLRIAAIAALLSVFTPFVRESPAATPRQQRAEIGQIARQARLAERRLEGEDTTEAAEALRDAVERIERLAAQPIDERLSRLVERAVELITDAHTDLAAAGVEMPWYRLPANLGAAASVAADTNRRGDDSRVSFSRQVAPLLLAKCGGCHVDDQKGGFSMATYTDLMRGSADSGKVLTPGGARGSLMIDLIEAGDMPRGDGQVTPQELAILVRWINEGARDDGPNPNTLLGQLATRSDAAEPPQPAAALPSRPLRITAATGEDTVRFALEIAPVLSAACLDCHGTRNPRADLSLTTFAGLAKGGRSGPIVAAGQPGASLLVRRLKGEGGDRMPLNRDPLPPATIAKIETWIREGAHFDGASPADTLARTNALARADAADPAELSQMRSELAERNWRLAMPDKSPRRAESPGFLVLGSLPAGHLEELAAEADRQIEAVAGVFRHPEGRPLVKSRITIFALARRFDYREFGTMVEGRELPTRWRGHWGYDGVDAYVAVYPAESGEFSNEVLLAQQIAGVYVADRGRGRLPRWLIEGAARAAAAQLDGRDPRVKAWDADLPTAVGRLKRPDDFMTGKLSLEDEGVLAYGFASRLLSKPGRFQQLLDRVAAGGSLDDALTQTYGGNSTRLAAAWIRSLRR